MALMDEERPKNLTIHFHHPQESAKSPVHLGYLLFTIPFKTFVCLGDLEMYQCHLLTLTWMSLKGPYDLTKSVSYFLIGNVCLL